MQQVIIAADAPWIRKEISSAIEDLGIKIIEVNHGVEVLPIVKQENPHLIILDFQIGNMGGPATALELHLEAEAQRLPHVPIALCLDRRADVFLAKRSKVEGWFIKPFNPIKIRKGVQALLRGNTYYDTYLEPVTLTQKNSLQG